MTDLEPGTRVWVSDDDQFWGMFVPDGHEGYDVVDLGEVGKAMYKQWYGNSYRDATFIGVFADWMDDNVEPSPTKDRLVTAFRAIYDRENKRFTERTNDNPGVVNGNAVNLATDNHVTE